MQENSSYKLSANLRTTMSRCNHSVITKRMVTFIAVMGSVCVMTLLYGAILSMPNSKFLTLNGVNNVTVKVLINNVLETSDNLDYPTFSIGNDLKKGVNTIKHSESDREKNVGQTLLMKLQKLLSSQPKSAKNSFQFNSIQRHLDTLLAMSVSQTVENKTTDDVSDSKKPSQLHLDQVEANVGRETGNEKRKEKKKEISAAIGETTTSAKLVTTEKPYCETQKYLKGRQDIPANVNVDQVKDPIALGRVRKGGLYQPEDCRPRASVAIIIPYRDRQKHLEIFINHMHSFLQRQQLQYGIFVVELARPTVFNRGLLANVGFLAAQGTGLYNCYVIHDVDLIPINDRNIYNCSDQLRHLSVANPKFGNGLPYTDYVGGVLALSEVVYVNNNGFSNLYFGWGGEDDDFSNRGKTAKYTIERPSKEDGAYVALPHGKDPANPDNPERFRLVTQGPNRRFNDGLNSMNYEQLSLTPLDQYTLVYVRVNKTQVLQTDIVRHVGDIELYESDVKTLRPKHAVNDKIINAYFRILQETSQVKIAVMRTTFKYQKKPWFPETLVSSKAEILFLPMKLPRYWTLTVIFCKENRSTFLDPTGNKKKMESDFIRLEYQSQFGIVLSEIEYFSKALTFDQDENSSGILIMMYAKRIAEGKPLTFEQVEIDAARVEIEKILRS